LKKEFEKSRIKDPSDFLIRKGYVKVASQGSYKKCVYISNGISEVQKELIKYFIKAGYEIENATVIDMIYDREDEER